MKKAILLIVLVLLLTPAAASAENRAAREETLRVTDINDTHNEGVLIGRELRLSRNLNLAEDIIVPFNPFHPDWLNVQMAEEGNWLRVIRRPGRKITVYFDRNFPARTLVGILEK